MRDSFKHANKTNSSKESLKKGKNIVMRIYHSTKRYLPSLERGVICTLKGLGWLGVHGEEMFSDNKSITIPNKAVCEFCLHLYDITVIIGRFADVVGR